MTNILSLLPYSLDSLLNDKCKKLRILKLFKFLVQELLESLCLLKAKKISRFDSHVGDTLCQIRAYKILLLSNKKLPDIVYEVNNFLNLLNCYLNEFELLMEKNKGKFNKNLDACEKIHEFFYKRKLVFELNDEFIFLTKSKILTDYSKVDSEGVSRGVDYNKFSEKSGITKSLSKRIMHWYQKRLASISSSFVFELLKDIPELYRNKNILKILEKVDQDGRKVLPSFEATKILLKHMLKKDILVVLEVETKTDKFHLFFSPNKHGTEFELMDKKNCSNETLCLVVSGISEQTTNSRDKFITCLLKIGISKIIKLNMACHPQYSAQDLEYLNADPYFNGIGLEKLNSFSGTTITALNKLKEEFIKMKELGNEIGCCKEKSSLFFVKHVFCEVSNNFINSKQPVFF